MNTQLMSLRRWSLRSGPVRALAALAFTLTTGSVFASWITIGEIPRLNVTVSMQTDGRVPRPTPLDAITAFFRPGSCSATQRRSPLRNLSRSGRTRNT
jgi:hypothetical protein